MRFIRLNYFLLATLFFVAFDKITINGSKIKFHSEPVLAQTSEHKKAGRLLELCHKHSSRQKHETAIQTCQKALNVFKTLEDQYREAEARWALGDAYKDSGQFDIAIPILEESLDLALSVNNRRYAIFAKESLIRIYELLDQPIKVKTLKARLEQYKLPAEEAQRFLSKGWQHKNKGELKKASFNLEAAARRYKSLGLQTKEFSALRYLGQVLSAQGKYQKAIEVFNQALDIKNVNVLQRNDIFGYIGDVYHSLGLYQKAIVFHNKRLTAARKHEVVSPKGVASSLGSLGDVYSSLGQYQKSIIFQNQRLELARRYALHNQENDALRSLGNTYQSLGQYQKAIGFHKLNLVFVREGNRRQDIAYALGNLGKAYQSLEQFEQAIQFHKEQLDIVRDIEDRQGEAIALGNLGVSYGALGNLPKAFDYLDKAIAIQQVIGDRAGQGTNLNHLDVLLANQQPELGIIFLKEAVNIREDIRRDLKGLSKADKQSYTDTISADYRHLADLLLQQDRVLEAQAILDLLKVQELDEYFRGVRGHGEKLTFLKSEREILERYQTSRKSAISLLQELDELTQLARLGSLSQEQKERRSQLLKLRQELQGQFNDFLKQPSVKALLQQLSYKSSRETLDLNKLASLQDNLTKINGLLLYPLILEDRLELVVTTSNAPPFRRVVPVGRTQLNQAIAEFRSAISSPNQNAIVPAQKLYNWLIRPLEMDLKQTDTKTILFAPDGQLRYIPLAALHDGQQWLTKAYNITNITTTSQTDFDSTPQGNPRILAGAFSDSTLTRTQQTSQGTYTFRGLPYAGKEVQALVASQPATTALINQEFNLTRTNQEMDLHQIIHFATHASFVPDDPDASFIVFGAGKNPTLRDIATWSLSHVELVVLSACETGLGGTLGTGVEVLGLGYQFQRSGAKAVIASLWQVSDIATQELMNLFYDGLKQGMSKSEALRQAQVKLMQNTDVSHINGHQTGILLKINTSKIKTALLQKHPYYWASFVLIGNGL